MKIVLIGHVCIDVNSSEDTSYTGWGSTLMYMGHYLHRHMALDPLLVAPYGRDFLPYAKGVTLLPPPGGANTMVYRNYLRDEQRTWRCEPGSAAEPVPLTADIQAHIAGADIICVAPLLHNLPADYVRQVLAARRPGSIAVLSTQGYLRTIDGGGAVVARDFAEAADILSLFDIALLSEDDLPDALAAARRWAERAASCHIIVTQGAAGASLVTAGQITAVATDPVPESAIVDSVGCGDVFAAAAMCQYYSSKDVRAAIVAGNTAARAKLFQTGVGT